MSKKDNGISLPAQQPAPKKRKDPNERIRKVAEREETREVKLTEVQRDEQRMIAMSLLDQLDEIEEKKKEVVKNYASQIAAVELQLHSARQLANGGKRRDTFLVEEWLTGANDVIRIRADTGEQLGDVRRARAEELQERLYHAGEDDPPPEGPPASEAFPAPEDAFTDDP